MSAETSERPPIGPDHQLPAPAPEKAQHKGVRFIAWIVVLALFAVGFLLVIRHHEDPSKKAAGGGRRGANAGPASITTVTAQKGDIGVYIDAIGTVTPVYTASITAQVTGTVTQVYYREGQIIQRGAPLLDIDPRQYQATLLQAQGLLERDQGILAQAQMDVERYKKAWDRNAIPQQTLDDQEKLVVQDEGTVKNDAGTVAYDEVQLGFCHLVAPITGRVGLRLVDPGNIVQANSTTPLAVITQMQPITTIFTIPEDSLGQVQPRLRQNAKLVVDAYDRTDLKKIASGTLLTLDNQIDTTTGTVKARAQYTNKDLSLFPNQFVNARLLVNTLHNATLIPSSAIQHNGQAAYVYVIQDGPPPSAGAKGGAKPGDGAGGASGANETSGKTKGGGGSKSAGGAAKGEGAGAAQPASGPQMLAIQRAVTVGVTDGGTSQVTGINPGDVLANSTFDKLQDKQPVIISNKPVQQSNMAGSSAP